MGCKWLKSVGETYTKSSKPTTSMSAGGLGLSSALLVEMRSYKASDNFFSLNPSVTVHRQTLGSRVTTVVTFRLWTVILTPTEVVEINGWNHENRATFLYLQVLMAYL